jgi:hypothetical protein
MKKIIARLEALFKGVAFDCHACGQCVWVRIHKRTAKDSLELPILPQLVDKLPRSGFTDKVRSNKVVDMATSAGRRP